MQVIYHSAGPARKQLATLSNKFQSACKSVYVFLQRLDYISGDYTMRRSSNDGTCTGTSSCTSTGTCSCTGGSGCNRRTYSTMANVCGEIHFNQIKNCPKRFVIRVLTKYTLHKDNFELYCCLLRVRHNCNMVYV